MKNFIFISPNFPDNYWKFCCELANNGLNVLGIGDCPYENLTDEVRNSVNEYYRVSCLENYEEVYRAVAFFIFKYGKIEFLESNNEYWLERDALLRTEFNINTGFRLKDVKKIKYKSQMKKYYAKAGVPTAAYCLVKTLKGCDFHPIPDRIEAGTFLVAAAMCGGEVCAEGVCPENISSLIHKLRENGCKIHIKNDKIIIENHRRLISVKTIETQPYPGFPTDLQAQITALCCVCGGNSIVTENLFETRFKYVPELKKMGADITVIDRNAFVRGVDRLKGADLVAHDLRGGAALVLAALAAEGRSGVVDIYHIDRGYGSFEYKLRMLGGDIVRVTV